MKQTPLVSIVITNYNYGRYLQQAIDSALTQTHPHTEVIVVDDGSTDSSHEVVLANRSRVTPIIKANGGQASAMNAGFAQSRGDAVIFLDADDILLPNAAARAAAAFAAEPTLATVQYRLELISVNREPLGITVPSAHVHMPTGDLRACWQRMNNTTWWSPTSGNAFARHALEAILPIPESDYRVSADHYLNRAAALAGPIRSLDEALGLYRIHGANHFNVSTVNLKQLRAIIGRIDRGHVHLKTVADRLGIQRYPARASELQDVMFLSQRMVSKKLEPTLHPIADDTLLGLSLLGIDAALNRPDVGARVRTMHAAWFVAMLLASPAWAVWLANKLFYPQTRSRYDHRGGVAQGG